MGGAAKGEHVDKFVEVIGHEHNVGALHRDIASGRTHSGRIIGAVTDHGDFRVGRHLVDFVDLVFRKEVRVNGVHADACGDGVSHRQAVAGQHGNRPDSVVPQLRDDVRGFRAHGIGNRENSE